MNKYGKSVLDNIEDFFSKRSDAKTYIGTVRYAFPWENLYVVQPVRDGVLAHTLELVAGPDTATHAGSINSTYTIGSSVIVCSDKGSHGSMSVTDYIIGPATLTNNDEMERTLNSVAPESRIGSFLSDIFDKLRGICGSLYANVPKSYSHPDDLLSGDINITSAPYTGVSSLKHMLRIQCGRRCFVELDSIMSRIRIVTEKMEYIGPLRYYQDMSGRGSLLEYNQTALSFEEGTNGLQDPASEFRPVYRKKEVAGDVTTGWQTTVSIPELASGKSDDVFSSKVRYDGLSTVVSAKGFEIRKSLDIISPYQIEEPKGFGCILKEVEDFPDLSDNYKKSDKDKLMDDPLSLAQSGVIQRESEFPRVDINKDKWGTTDTIHTDKINEDTIQAIRNPELDNIGSVQYYDLPDTVELKDPHTGKTYTYFKSNSGIKYEPDGSVVFYDGYGSEIRMTRGNIIISPSADLIFRPGRDIHSMAGRHTAIVSQGHAIVHSSNKNVYIKGQQDVNILAGVDTNGRILLDDRGSVGTLIRSASNSSLVAKDVFVGSIPEKSDNNYSGATKGPGTVTIGGGVRTLITGDNVTVYGESADIIGKKDKDVSWLSIDYNRIHSISETINLSGDVTIGNASGTLVTTVGNMTIGAGNQTSSPYLHVIANMDISYGLNCRQVWAEQVLATRMAAGNASRTSGLKQHVPAPAIGQTSPTVTQTSAPMYSYSGPWSDTYTIKSGFMYPSSGELGIYGASYVIPGMLWQKYLKDAKVWKEDSIPVYGDTKESMVYPGIEAWSGSITTGSGMANLIGGYKINGR